MDSTRDFLAGLGFGTSSAQKKAQQNLEDAKSTYGALTPPTLSPVNYQGPDLAAPGQATLAGPSGLANINVNPAYNEAQMAQLAALSNLAASGGRNAASDANLAAIQENELANARGQREAILQNANMRGMGGSGQNLLSQLVASQGAISDQNARDLGVLGQQAQTGLQAGQAAAGIGAGLQQQNWNQAAQAAAAQDAINRFNAQNATGMSQFNTAQQQNVLNSRAAAQNATETMNKYQMPEAQWGNQMQKAGGMAGADLAGTNFYQNQANMNAQQAGNMLGAGVKLYSALTTPAAAAGAGGTAMAGEASPALLGGLLASFGGKVPGTPLVPGNHPANDFVTTQTSPGEVVVPRTLANFGTPHQIGSFVKNPPMLKQPSLNLLGPQALGQNKDKEAMLSALKNIRRKRGM